jgi:hypothetical protein
MDPTFSGLFMPLVLLPAAQRIGPLVPPSRETRDPGELVALCKTS